MAAKSIASRRWTPIAIAFAALAIVFVPAPAIATPPADRHIRIEAGRFAYTPAEIGVNPGDHVTIDLVATDVVHGLYIDSYDLSAVADPGQTTQLTFVADRPGMFRLRCSVTCGALHPFMIGKLSVGPNWDWLRASGLAILAALAGVWLLRK